MDTEKTIYDKYDKIVSLSILNLMEEFPNSKNVRVHDIKFNKKSTKYWIVLLNYLPLYGATVKIHCNPITYFRIKKGLKNSLIKFSFKKGTSLATIENSFFEKFNTPELTITEETFEEIYSTYYHDDLGE